MDDFGNLLHFDLTEDEREFLVDGMDQWDGPAHSTDGLAQALGLRDRAEMLGELRVLREAVTAGRPLGRLDWTRVLLSTEIAFASDVLGAGVEWEIVTRWGDEASLEMLRTIQRKIVSAVHGNLG